MTSLMLMPMEEGMGGIAYIAYAAGGAKGIAKLLSAERLEGI